MVCEKFKERACMSTLCKEQNSWVLSAKAIHIIVFNMYTYTYTCIPMNLQALYNDRIKVQNLTMW